MTLVDDRTFIRHFSMVLGGLIGMTIFFIFLAFLIVDVTGVDSHSGYTYVPPKAQKQQSAQAGSSASQSAAGGAAAAQGSSAVAANSSASGGGSGGGGAAAAAAGSAGKKQVASNNAAPDGKAIWQAHCSVCHQTGVAGAPKIGDKAAWKPILAEADMKTIFHRDINGYTGKRGTMPAKGGNPNLSDAEVIAAAKYMIGQSGGNPGS